MTDRIVLAKDGTHYFLAGREVTEEVYREVYPLPPEGSGIPGGTPCSGWPMLSEAAAVHPEQVEEAIQSARAKGIPTEFIPDGRVIFRDRAHRRAYLKAYGFHDRQGGYGDG